MLTILLALFLLLALRFVPNIQKSDLCTNAVYILHACGMSADSDLFQSWVLETGRLAKQNLHLFFE